MRSAYLMRLTMLMDTLSRCLPGQRYARCRVEMPPTYRIHHEPGSGRLPFCRDYAQSAITIAYSDGHRAFRRGRGYPLAVPGQRPWPAGASSAGWRPRRCGQRGRRTAWPTARRHDVDGVGGIGDYVVSAIGCGTYGLTRCFQPEIISLAGRKSPVEMPAIQNAGPRAGHAAVDGRMLVGFWKDAFQDDPIRN